MKQIFDEMMRKGLEISEFDYNCDLYKQYSQEFNSNKYKSLIFSGYFIFDLRDIDINNYQMVPTKWVIIGEGQSTESIANTFPYYRAESGYLLKVQFIWGRDRKGNLVCLYIQISNIYSGEKRVQFDCAVNEIENFWRTNKDITYELSIKLANMYVFELEGTQMNIISAVEYAEKMIQCGKYFVYASIYYCVELCCYFCDNLFRYVSTSFCINTKDVLLNGALDNLAKLPYKYNMI